MDQPNSIIKYSRTQFHCVTNRGVVSLQLHHTAPHCRHTHASTPSDNITHITHTPHIPHPLFYKDRARQKRNQHLFFFQGVNCPMMPGSLIIIIIIVVVVVVVVAYAVVVLLLSWLLCRSPLLVSACSSSPTLPHCSIAPFFPSPPLLEQCINFTFKGYFLSKHILISNAQSVKLFSVH